MRTHTVAEFYGLVAQQKDFRMSSRMDIDQLELECLHRAPRQFSLSWKEMEIYLPREVCTVYALPCLDRTSLKSNLLSDSELELYEKTIKHTGWRKSVYTLERCEMKDTPEVVCFQSLQSD